MDYRWANSDVFIWLTLLPVCFLLFLWAQYRRKKVLERVFSSRLVSFLTQSVSLRKRHIRLSLFLMACLFLILSWARPQAGRSETKVKSEGVEIFLLVDVSNSMRAEDAKPSRLELAKRELLRFLDMGGGDRIGLIAFAGSAVLLSPLTTDRSALKMFIESLSSDTVFNQGTNYKDALWMAKEAFERGGVEPDKTTSVTRAIVIVSDGEDNEPGAMRAAEQLIQKGIHIFSLVVGTEKGAPIPLRRSDGTLKGYQKDKQGNIVITKTKGTVLKALAQKGQGGFYHLFFGGNAIKKLKEDIDHLQKAEFESSVVVDYKEYYQWPLFMALLLMFLEWQMGERKKEGSRVWLGRFEGGVSP
ncbi:MAG: VWA domain-containing protein [Bdellovibrio sp.]|nr:MAG: VWA domain-containing protein [Bdellovibrio sp.]